MPTGHIGEARAISNKGFVAVTVHVSEEADMAAVLVPLDWSNDVPPAKPVVSGDVTYEAKVLAQSDDLPGQDAVAIDDQGRVAVHEPFYVEATDAIRGVTAWRDVNGTSRQLFPAGELSGEVFPARASGNGNLVATGWVREEFTDVKYYRPFLSMGGADFAPVPPPEWAVHLFGYGVDDGGNLLAECLTPDGYVACTRDPQGSWLALFLGRPHAFSKNGLVGGETATDAVIADAKNMLELGLGPGAAVYARSRDGRCAAGIAGHAFVYDREPRVFDWLPDFAGDPATVGRVVPRARLERRPEPRSSGLRENHVGLPMQCKTLCSAGHERSLADAERNVEWRSVRYGGQQRLERLGSQVVRIEASHPLSDLASGSAIRLPCLARRL